MIHRILILSLCLIVAGWLVQRDATLPVSAKSIPLRQALSNIDEWQPGPFTILDDKIVNALELDDYLNQQFRQGNDSVSFYIGYYLTAKKIGAAHDPMVCFPGQGWKITDRSSGQLSWKDDQEHTVNYSSMIGQLGQNRELIVYWFQSYDQTSPSTFLQKIKLMKNNIMRKSGDNAFCRVTVSLDNATVEEAMALSADFIQSVYPVFQDYVVSG